MTESTSDAKNTLLVVDKYSRDCDCSNDDNDGDDDKQRTLRCTVVLVVVVFAVNVVSLCKGNCCT